MLGSAELLVVGVLNLIAADLTVSIPAAGTLVTVYALGLEIGGPLLTALTINLTNGPCSSARCCCSFWATWSRC